MFAGLSRNVAPKMAVELNARASRHRQAANGTRDGQAGAGAPGMTDDLVDEFYRPLVQPLGNLVILCAQCEASLLDLVAALHGTDDEWRAQAALKPPNAKERVPALVRASGFQGFELTGAIARRRSVLDG